MKIKDGFILREVAGNFIVVAVGSTAKSFNGMINLNETGAFLWKKMQDGSDAEGLKNALLEEYEIDENTAEKHAKAFIDKLVKAGLVD